MPEETELDAELIAAIDEAEPAFVIPEDERAVVWFSIACGALRSIGQEGILVAVAQRTWPEGYLPDGDFRVPAWQNRPDILHPLMAHVAEEMILELKGYLRDRGVPSLSGVVATHVGYVGFRFQAAS